MSIEDKKITNDFMSLLWKSNLDDNKKIEIIAKYDDYTDEELEKIKKLLIEE